ncbi:myosin regulatory light polypeptide 9 [Nannospalax galili]|uniref:myosin regulatory light polypeptide 9 n=1 Tax=Nannospalax galili TaxID=1026970 RepID=UPI0004ED4190|nr:myosin regulatory light polypeptide 9 [Nannospalax galili]
MSSKRAKAKTTKKRPQRATSNVFTMFDQSQIQEFKEAFNMIDQNRDGFIDKEDLHDMLASLGEQDRPDRELRGGSVEAARHLQGTSCEMRHVVPPYRVL